METKDQILHLVVKFQKINETNVWLYRLKILILTMIFTPLRLKFQV